jgi:phosphosulfolactate phosphohydrolase-like enzyme
MNIIRSTLKTGRGPAQFLYALALWAIWLLAAPASAAVVTLKVVDQHGQEIPGSQIAVLSLAATTGDSLTLPEGTHVFTVAPGAFGRSWWSWLSRTDVVEITPATTELVFEWITAAVALRLQDQHGVEIAGSQVGVGPSTFNGGVITGGTVVLPITDDGVYPTIQGNFVDGHDFTVIPGAFDRSHSAWLSRFEEGYEVTAITTQIVFEWITAAVVLRLQDQHGVEIAGSQIGVGPSTWAGGVVTGGTVVLPITDDTVYPTIAGHFLDGHDFTVIPGAFDRSHSAWLSRFEEGYEVTAITTQIVFEWITAAVTLRLQDQHGVEIAGSQIGVGPSTWAGGVVTGGTVVLPITDDTVYPTIAGHFLDGHDFALMVRVGGTAHPAFLMREEFAREVTVATAEIAYTWIQHRCALELRDAGNQPVTGSVFVLPSVFFGHLAPGEAPAFPVNDLAVYPTASGHFINGYPITVSPGDIAPASSEIYFTVNAAGEFTPGSFSIGGNVYGLALACDDGCEPLAVASLTAPAAPLALGTAATVTAHFAAADNDSGRICSFDWGDGTFDPGLDASGATVAASHTYATPGVYRVTVTAENACGDVDIAVHEFVVIYDPEGGFVTGGGWINSPVDAYAANPALTGKANFGFVSKYLKGANVPTGNTEFQFKAGDLNFKSTSYDWLVVAGAKAKFKGSGTINGAGDFAFQLTATDGQASGGGGADTFRIKIWSKSGGGVIYDNQPSDADTADATTALGGGSIVVHKP